MGRRTQGCPSNSAHSKTPETAAGRQTTLDCTSEGSMMLQNLAGGRRAEGRGGGEKEMGRTVRQRGRERVSAFQVTLQSSSVFPSPNLSRTLSENQSRTMRFFRPSASQELQDCGGGCAPSCFTFMSGFNFFNEDLTAKRRPENGQGGMRISLSVIYSFRHLFAYVREHRFTEMGVSKRLLPCFLYVQYETAQLTNKMYFCYLEGLLLNNFVVYLNAGRFIVWCVCVMCFELNKCFEINT